MANKKSETNRFHLVYIDREADMLRKVSCKSMEHVAEMISKLPDDNTELAVFYGSEISYQGREQRMRVKLGSRVFIPNE